MNAYLPTLNEITQLHRCARELVQHSRGLAATTRLTCDQARLLRAHARELRNRHGPARCGRCRQAFAAGEAYWTVEHVPAGWAVTEETVVVHTRCVAAWVISRARRACFPGALVRGTRGREAILSAPGAHARLLEVALSDPPASCPDIRLFRSLRAALRGEPARRVFLTVASTDESGPARTGTPPRPRPRGSADGGP